ncbi:MAG: ABC transporter permease [Treponema sp.]|nr:ABC transporter permease [Treponema sp.]
MKLIAGLQYRAAAWAGVATQFFWGGVSLLVFAAFYQSAGLGGAGGLAGAAAVSGEAASSGSPGPMDFGQLADLVWLRQAFLALVMLWSMDNELLDLIAGGNLAYELCRPLSLYGFWFFRILALRISRTLLRCAPILAVAFLLPEPWRFHPPPNPAAALLFIPSLCLAALLVTALCMFTCVLTFLSLNPHGARFFFGTLGEFLMGALIPIPFMPRTMQRVLGWLPFRYTADFPFRLYSGHIAGGEALAGLGMQCGWTALLVALGILSFRAIQRRVVIQGG